MRDRVRIAVPVIAVMLTKRKSNAAFAGVCTEEKKMKSNRPQIPNNLPESAHRPGWTQADLHAYRHLHRFGEIRRNHFVGTRGFATMSDLRFFENGGYGDE